MCGRISLTKCCVAVPTFPKSTCLLGLNELKIAPVAAGEQDYQVPPLRGDVELNMSHQCAPVGHRQDRTPWLNLTGFISFSLKQKIIASQQAFLSKPLH